MQYSLSELGIEQMLGAGLESYRAWRRDYNAMCTIVIQCSRRVAIDVGVMCPSEGFLFHHECRRVAIDVRVMCPSERRFPSRSFDVALLDRTRHRSDAWGWLGVLP